MNVQTLPLSQILTSVQFVTVAQDRQMAVVDADEWNQLMEWLDYTFPTIDQRDESYWEIVEPMFEETTHLVSSS